MIYFFDNKFNNTYMSLIIDMTKYYYGYFVITVYMDLMIYISLLNRNKYSFQIFILNILH